jgi:hypothetical protein
MGAINLEKVAIPVKKVKIDLYDDTVSVEVKQVISLSDLYNIISAYVKKYYDNSGFMQIEKVSTDRIGAEIIIRLKIISSQTNIEIAGMDDNLLLNDYFYNQIVEHVYNYKTLLELIDKTIMDISRENYNFSYLKDIVEKVSLFVENLNSIDTESFLSDAKNVATSIQTISNKPVKEKRKRHETASKEVS